MEATKAHEPHQEAPRRPRCGLEKGRGGEKSKPATRSLCLCTCTCFTVGTCFRARPAAAAPWRANMTSKSMGSLMRSNTALMCFLADSRWARVSKVMLTTNTCSAREVSRRRVLQAQTQVTARPPKQPTSGMSNSTRRYWYLPLQPVASHALLCTAPRAALPPRLARLEPRRTAAPRLAARMALLSPPAVPLLAPPIGCCDCGPRLGAGEGATTGAWEAAGVTGTLVANGLPVRESSSHLRGGCTEKSWAVRMYTGRSCRQAVHK